MKSYLCLFLSLALFSCSNENASDSDSTATAENQASRAPVRDSILIDTAASSLKWKRDRTVKDVVQKIKFGKATIDMKMDEASFSLEGDIPVNGGAWYTSNKHYDGGKLRFDMTKLKGVKINDEQQLEFSSPDYLDVASYPDARLLIRSISEKPDSSGMLTAEAELTIKDTTGVISFPVKAERDKNGVPETFQGRFEIDGIAWGLNRKNKKQKVAKDRLVFDLDVRTRK